MMCVCVCVCMRGRLKEPGDFACVHVCVCVCVFSLHSGLYPHPSLSPTQQIAEVLAQSTLIIATTRPNEPSAANSTNMHLHGKAALYQKIAIMYRCVPDDPKP